MHDVALQLFKLQMPLARKLTVLFRNSLDSRLRTFSLSHFPCKRKKLRCFYVVNCIVRAVSSIRFCSFSRLLFLLSLAQSIRVFSASGVDATAVCYSRPGKPAILSLSLSLSLPPSLSSSPSLSTVYLSPSSRPFAIERPFTHAPGRPSHCVPGRQTKKDEV